MARLDVTLDSAPDSTAAEQTVRERVRVSVGGSDHDLPQWDIVRVVRNRPRVAAAPAYG